MSNNPLDPLIWLTDFTTTTHIQQNHCSHFQYTNSSGGGILSKPYLKRDLLSPGHPPGEGIQTPDMCVKQHGRGFQEVISPNIAQI